MLWLVVASLLFDTPERHVARYLDGTARGDSQAATAPDMESGGLVAPLSTLRWHWDFGGSSPVVDPPICL